MPLEVGRRNDIAGEKEGGAGQNQNNKNQRPQDTQQRKTTGFERRKFVVFGQVADGHE